MIIGADGLPLRRSVLLLNTVGIGYRCGVQLLRQTDGWYRGVKAVWVPRGDGSLHDILWASFDQDEPVPDWIRRVPWFTMATAFLTTASVSPWTVDPTWNAASNSVELVGAGGSGALGTTGANSVGGGGGSAGRYVKLTNGAVTGTVAFRVGVGGEGDGGPTTAWESATGASNCYLAPNGGNGISSGGGNSSSLGASTTQGVPGVTFTVSVSSNGGTGAASGTNQGGAGGGAPAGASAAGGNGGSTATGNGGSGGGGANNGATGNGAASSGTVTGGNGGPGSSGSGGSGGTTTGGNGTGNSGGEGSDGSAVAGTALTGGNGGSGTDFDATHGLGGGGGGCGQYSVNSGTPANKGGDGGLYGAAGAGTGGTRVAGGTRTAGVGADGVIGITWTPATTAFVYFDSLVSSPNPHREPFRAVGGSPTISDQDSPRGWSGWRKA